MRIPRVSRYTLSSCVAAALLAGCGGSQPPIGASGVMPRTSMISRPANSPYKVVYSFGTGPDGNAPGAGVLGRDGNGILYGTTIFGGAFKCSQGYRCGTVFSITTGGTEKVLHSFETENDGANPEADLIDVGRTLYGTTYSGAFGYGAVFSITTRGLEKVLHSFGNGTDGRNPTASLSDAKGTLYGTTEFGGKRNRGTVFSITTGGTEKVVHSFGKETDGSQPLAQLTYVGGTFYGTTNKGGRYTCGRFTCGTVFNVTTGGTEKMLHSFGKGTDGDSPGAGLIEVAGRLYGTTSKGGAYTCAGVTCGTVFSITTDGVEKVLHSFNGTDGQDPAAGLVDVNGTLYGTTYLGGAHARGAIFSITTDGTEKVLHSFGKGTDGSYPRASMYYKDGSLVGTTQDGGAYGHGTVFSLAP